MKIKIMTFNVQHFRDYRYPQENRVDFDYFAPYIAAKGADIVGLNEVFNRGKIPQYERQAFIVAEKAGYKKAYFAEATTFDGTGSYGNAMISKYDFEGERIYIPDPQESELNGKYAETRCVLKGEFSFGEKKLTVLSCHFGLNDAEARNAVDTICEIVEKIDNPVILMGDFNQEPNSPLLAPLFERFKNTEHFFGKENGTFPSDAPELKIDYIFTRGEIEVLSATIHRDVVSDHCSITAEVEF